MFIEDQIKIENSYFDIMCAHTLSTDTVVSTHLSLQTQW